MKIYGILLSKSYTKAKTLAMLSLSQIGLQIISWTKLSEMVPTYSTYSI